MRPIVLYSTKALSVCAIASILVSISGIFVPHVQAATLLSAQKLTVATSTPDNTYILAGQTNINAPMPADVCAIAGTITVAAPITGDALFAAGTVDIQRPVTGDVRAVGGRVSDEDSVGGDLMIAGGSISVSGKAKNTHIVGGTVDLTNGSNGPVTIYGGDIALAGEFNGDVEVVASNKVSLSEYTVIHGTLKYNAPQQAAIPDSAHVDGGVNYIGSAGWLPTDKQAKTYATAGLFVFFLVKITAALVVTGLIAGLFPTFTNKVVETTIKRTPEHFTLMTLLGFAGFLAVPVLVIFLVASFVGIGIAFFLIAGYMLFLLLAYVYAGIIAGAALVILVRRSRFFAKRISSHTSWRVAILGVLVLYVVGSLPFVGLLLRLILCATAGGALLTLFYSFAFKSHSSEDYV